MSTHRLKKPVLSPPPESLESLRLRTRMITQKVQSVLVTVEQQRVKMRKQRQRMEIQKAAVAAVWIGSDGTQPRREQLELDQTIPRSNHS